MLIYAGEPWMETLSFASRRGSSGNSCRKGEGGSLPAASGADALATKQEPQRHTNGQAVEEQVTSVFDGDGRQVRVHTTESGQWWRRWWRR